MAGCRGGSAFDHGACPAGSSLRAHDGAKAGAQGFQKAAWSIYPENDQDLETLLKRADEDLYRRKGGSAQA
jgi:hypothetical protein